jgi:hypothetical protein
MGKYSFYSFAELGAQFVGHDLLVHYLPPEPRHQPGSGGGDCKKEKEKEERRAKSEGGRERKRTDGLN